MHSDDVQTRRELLEREKDRLAARLQHIVVHIKDELAQSLASLQDMTQLLQSSGLRGDQGGYVDVIRRTVDDMHDVLCSVVAMIVPDMTCTGEPEASFDLLLLLDDVFNVFRGLSRREGLHTEIRIADNVPCHVAGRPGVIRRLVSALLQELMSAPSDSSIQLQVSVDGISAKAIRLRCTGVVNALLENCDDDRCRMIQHLAACVDGTFSFQVGENRTESVLQFKLHVPSETNSDLPEPLPIDGKSLLVVDPDVTWRSVVRELCYLWGCVFQEAADATAALDTLHHAAARGNPVDFVLTDQHLGTMSASEFGQVVRADESVGAPVLIMVASGARAGDAVRMEDAGFDAFLPRPVSQRRLRDSLRLLLARRQHGQHQRIVTRHVVAEESRRRQRILVVDDNDTNLKVVEMMLKRGGYTCDVARSAEEGLEMMQQSVYAMTYMDISMPGMNGFEAVRHIRSTTLGQNHRALPVVALTAYEVGGKMEEYLTAGFSDVLEKPLDYRVLMRITKRFLDSSDENAPVDINALLQQLDGDREIAREILQTFVLEAEKRIQELQSLLQGGNLTAAHEKAHALAGMSGNIRARELRCLAEQVEQACVRQQSFRAVETAADMEKEMERIRRIAATV